MLYIYLVLINCMLYFEEAHLAIAVRKFVHQKDISDYCRRRVVPSVFLGKHVVDANSQILHFSQLEMPYSCSISVRTEFGNNIILVIQLLSERSLTKSCRSNNNQLLIYELGETFGGYWGVVPDTMIKHQPQNYTKYYTLKTTPTTEKTTVTEYESEYDHQETDSMKPLISRAPDDIRDEDFIRIDVPLVNISGDLGFDEISSHKRLDTDELFDLIYDVTPRNGISYDTSIVPLVQFSIKKQMEDQRRGNYLQPKYELDYSYQGFTPDSRISYNTLYKKKVTRKYRITKRLKFRRKNKALSRAKTTPLRKLRPYYSRVSTLTTKPYETWTPMPTIHENLLSLIYNNSAVKSGKSWEFIDDLMKSFNLTATAQISSENYTDSSFESVPYTQISTHMNRSFPTEYLISEGIPSVYSVNSNKSPEKSPSPEHKFSKNTTIKTENIVKINISQTVQSTKTPLTSVEEPSDYIDEVKIFFTSTKTTEHESGSLVNHKSFENVVQAAPDIAMLLNTNYNVEMLSKEVQNVTSNVRKKRYIKALEIENARPRNLTTLKYNTRTTEKVYRYSDMQDLAQLVELEDDEIQGRVALRYLRKYVGSALFNICDYNEPKARQVYLFNSSRIVIAISNFTMDRMTLVVTPASTLMSSVGRCPPAHLECQVAGTRVCIDATNECDGVPNCGAYDIYDEDRLRCGWSLGLQHNVCLAACTFLAVILTMLYTIHYWLKRCVPRVSEAFFVYSDTSENTLYLDSIMRSPNDNTDDYSKLFYQANIFDDDEEFMIINTKRSRYDRLKSFLLSCIFSKKKTIAKECIDEPAAHEMLNMTSLPRTTYSFTEYELRDITPVIKDAKVQTGSSLEIRDTRNRNENYQRRPRNDKASISSDLEQGFSDNSSELNLLKLIRNLKISPKTSNESQSNLFVNKKEGVSHKILVTEEEKELHSTLYEPSTSGTKKQQIQKTTIPAVQPIKPKPVLSKHLRFDEDITTIPSPEYAEDDSVSHHSVVGVGSSRHLNTIEEVDEHGSSSNDFIRFWRSGKNKKSHKKSHLFLH